MKFDQQLSQLIEKRSFQLFMLICIVGYALFKKSYRELGDVFETLFLLASIVTLYTERKFIFKDKILIALILSLFLQILSWLNSLIEIPNFAQPKPDMSPLFTFFLFFFIAYWLKGKLLNVYIFLGAYCIGFILLLIVSSDFLKEIQNGLIGHRVDFNVTNAQHPAMMGGVSLIINLFYLCKISLKIYQKKCSLSKYAGLLAILLPSICFFSLIVMITQTRQVWIALALSTIITTLFYYCVYLNKYKKRIFVLGFATFALLFFAVSSSQIIKHRIGSESQVYKTIFHGDLLKIPYSSIGIRIHLWNESIDWIKANPIVGLGAKSVELVITESIDLPNNITNKFRHLHNSHIETLIFYGALGLILLYWTYFYVFSTINLQDNKEGTIEIKLLAIFLISYWLIVNIFESYFYERSGQLVNTIILASLYTFHLTNSLHERKQKLNITNEDKA